METYLGGAMFPRIKTFLNQDGSTRKYLYIVENRKVKGRTKQIITANLGRLHNADEQINDLIEKFSKLTTKVKELDEDLSVTEVLEDLRKIKAVKINLDNKSYVIRTELTGAAHFAFKAAKLKIPDRIISTSSKSNQKVMLRA